MKKRISILLALVMLLSLCACGSSAAQTEASMDIAPMEAPRSVMASSNESASAAADVPDVDPEKIIYSADATVETTEFDSTLKKVADMIKRYNGWIESSSVNGANYYSTARGNVSSRSAYYTLRVPSTSFNEIMTGLHRERHQPVLRHAGAPDGIPDAGGTAAGDDGKGRDRGGHHHH